MKSKSLLVTMHIGLVTRITAILFIIEMIGAILIVKSDNGFMGQGGFEVDLLLMLFQLVCYYQDLAECL